MNLTKTDKFKGVIAISTRLLNKITNIIYKIKINIKKK